MIDRALERLLFASRWLLVPFYLGLVVALALLVVKFVQKLIALFPDFMALDLSATIVASLKLVDLTLVGNLILMVILVGYETFVARISHAEDDDRPHWMGTTDFGDLKIKLFTSIVAIAAIQLLEGFMDIANTGERELAWMVGILLAFVITGLLLAVMERVAGKHDAEPTA